MAPQPVAMLVNDNPQCSRYEAILDGTMAVLEYRRMGHGLIALNHTGVPEAIGGRGVAEALARASLDEARTRSLDVLPFCPYVLAFIRRHPEYRDLISSRFKWPGEEPMRD